MDAGLQTNELARMLGVTEDTAINWELRGLTPRTWNLEKIEAVIDDLLSCDNQDAS
jgi:DNA-binding transcriptional regulator YiaG